MKKIFLLFLNFNLMTTGAGFETIDDAVNYALYYPEDIPPADITLMDSHYGPFHQTIRESWWQNTLRLLGFPQRPIITKTQFVQELQHLTKDRELLGFTSNYAIKINSVTPTIDIYAWGPLYGQFHSLVACLQKLYLDKIIDNHFVIQKPNTYLIFNGNMINSSPYNTETLLLLFQILKQNPTAAFYISGNYEFEHLWLNFSFKQELDIRFTSPLYASNNFEPLLNRFFATLPLAVYVQLICQPNSFVRFSYFNRQYPFIQEKYCEGLTKISYENSISICKFENDVSRIHEQPIRIPALVTAEDRLINYSLHEGLAQREPYLESTVWTLFSAPTYKYRNFFNFYHDAFTHITIAQRLEQSTIALYAQDVRERRSFELKKNYSFITGQNIQASTPDTTIPEPLYVGCTLDLSRSIAQQGEMLRRGIMLKINQVNNAGGINGRYINMIFMDDGYAPERARANMEDFIKKYNGFITLSSTGSATLAAYLDLVERQKLFVFFPTTGSSKFRSPALKNIINWRASYQDEAMALTNYINQTYKPHKFAIIYQQDIADDVVNGVLHMLNNDTSRLVKIPYERATLAIAPMLETIESSRTNAIGFFSTTPIVMEFLKKASDTIIANQHLFGLSFLAEDLFFKTIERDGIKFVVTQVVPPLITDWELLREYKDQIAKMNEISTPFTLEGYISASLMVDILQRVQGDITSETINKALETMDNYTYKGMQLNFDASMRSIAHYLWLYLEKDKWLTIQNHITGTP